MWMPLGLSENAQSLFLRIFFKRYGGMSMFYAETTDGERVQAEECGQQIRQEDFFCPGCREPVFLKQGQLRMAHFAHYREAGCSTFSEGETEQHLLGKQLLYSWLKGLGMTVEMEPWLPRLQQRPDVLVKAGEDRRIVLEYQCSPIPLEHLRERTEGYRREGYEVVWLLGMDYGLGGRLRGKQVAFLAWTPIAAYSLACLDSERGEVQVYQQIHYDNRNHLRYAKRRVPLSRLDLSGLLALVRGEQPATQPFPLRQATNTLTNRQRMMLLRRRDEEHRRFLEQVYLQRESLNSLPDFLFRKPTKTLLYVTPAYIWKYDFLLWLKGQEGNILQVGDVERYCQQAVQKRSLRVRSSLTLDTGHYVQPVLGFLAALSTKGAVTLVGPDCWLIAAVPL